jgi:tetratricopeptide (TPR) repeat protein
MPGEAAIHPFPGLRPFEAEEHELFFGREGQSEEILGRLHHRRLVAVVGASGSGKSSLIRAGLLPYLHGGFLAQAGSRWRIALFRPGGDPIKNLATALNDPAVLGQDAAATAESTVLLEVSLRRSGLGLIDAVRLARLPAEEQLLIVVDQFEELFRFADATGRPGQDEDAAAFVKLLLEAGRQREVPIYIVLTMRSDYIGDCARYRDLPETVTDGLYLIPRMTRDQRRAAIVEPVRVGGGTIAPRLVVRLLNDVGDDPDQLPILQHALMRTWDYWQAHGAGARPIDVEDYLAIGGMADALSQHADEAYAGLPDDRYRAIAKRVFQALSEKGPDNRETRRPTTIGSLALVTDAPITDIIRVDDDFRAPGRSFLMPAAGVALNPLSVIDISHESLIRGWRRMRQWVDDEAESAREYRRLAETALLHAQGTAGLLHDPDLDHVLAWRNKEHPTADWARRYHPGFEQAMAFLEESRLARDAERRQRHAARRRVQIASSAATAIIAIVAVVAVWQWVVARAASDRAEKALTVALGFVNSTVFNTMEQFRLHGLSQEASDMSNRVIQTYDELIAISPLAAAYNGRGAAYFEKDDYDHAIADYTEAIKLDPKFAAAYGNRCFAYFLKRDYDNAIADCNQAIAIDPEYYLVYNTRGIAYAAKGDYDKAIADYTEAAKLNPHFALAYRNRGVAYAAKNDYDRAIADYTQAIKLDPKYPPVYENRGQAYSHKGDYDQAIADFTTAIGLDPKNTSYYIDRGNAYYAENDFDAAIADYSSAARLNPKDTIAFFNRGLAKYQKKDYAGAVADYTLAIALDPKDSGYYHDRGNAYYAKHDYDHAVADYTAAIALSPKNTDYYIDRGNAYKARGDREGGKGAHDQAIADYNRATADFTQVIAIDAKNAIAYNNRGNVHLAKGELDNAFAEYDQAIADYNQAIIFDPKYAVAYANRGFADRAKRDLDRAIADFSQAITLNAKLDSAYNGRGETYQGKGDLDRAMADYNQAITLDPKFASAYANRALVYEDKGDLDHAMADYNQAIALDPNFAFAYFARSGANFYSGHGGAAVDDAAKAVKLDPANDIFVVALYVARVRAGQSGGWDEFVANTQKLDKSEWPYPIIGVYLGSVTPEALSASAQSAPNEDVRHTWVCQEDFFLAMLRQSKGPKDQARALFQSAADTCPQDYTGYAEAKFELKANSPH